MLRAAIRRAWFGVGPVATMRAVLKRLRGADRLGAVAPAGPHPFDREFGVDTSGFVGWRQLQAGGPNDPFISGYFGANPPSRAG